MNIFVLDIGTSSMRGIVYSENGEKLLINQVKYQPSHGDNGMVEQAPKDFEEALIDIVTAVVKEKHVYERIDALSITSQRSAIIPVDGKGKPLMNAVMWQDTRNRAVCKSLEHYNKEIFRLSGAKVNCVFSGGKMLWIKREKPDVYEKVYKFVNIPEYLIHIMTDEYVTDYTYGSRSNLMNIRTHQWDERLLELFEIKKELLCELKEPGSVVGYIGEEFSKKTGLHVGIPVISAGGDQQCAALGRGVCREGDLSIVTGTGAFLVAAADEIPENLGSDIICNCASIPGKYIIEASVLACCSAFEWFAHTFYGEKPTNYSYINQRLEELYEQNSTCLVLPFFQGRSTPCWNADAKAIFSNITLGTGREEILKAILEGIFMEIRNNIDHFRKYINITSAYISGGLTNSEVINHIQADIYGIPLYFAKDTEAASTGALIVAMHHFYPEQSLKSIFKLFVDKQTINEILPNERKKVFYEKQREKMNMLYKKIYP